MEHGWLIVDSHTLAILKAVVNVSPRGFSDAAGILDYCVTHNLEFYVTVPDKMLKVFRQDFYSLPPHIRESSFLSHQPGWVEQDINDYHGITDLNQQYLHKVHKVLDRVNTGAFIMEGGVLAFLAKHLRGPWVIECMMDGPSVVANQFLKVHVHLPKPHESPMNLVCNQVTSGEQQALYGFIKQFDSTSRSLLPTRDCSNLILDILDRIKKREAEALTEVGWQDYLSQYMFNCKSTDVYKVTREDSLYDQSMINPAYPISWEKIKLTSIQVPKTFDGLHTNTAY